MGDSEAFEQLARIEATASNLRVDAAAAEVLIALAEVGAEGILLKGASIARWLYVSGEPRAYVDADLLLRPGDEGKAKAVLSGLGFEMHLDADDVPEWWAEHGTDWTRDQDGVVLDLHRELPGVAVQRETAWEILRAGSETMRLANTPVRVLGPAARLMHIAMHAAHHGSGWGKTLPDLERALELVDAAPLWRDARALAIRLGALDQFAAGLRLVPAGVALADQLALPEGGSVEVTLRASTPPPVALGIEQLVQARGPAMRLHILWRKLVPPLEFMHHWSETPLETPWQVTLAYVRRPLWILRRVPRGLTAWKRARREVRERTRHR